MNNIKLTLYEGENLYAPFPTFILPDYTPPCPICCKPAYGVGKTCLSEPLQIAYMGCLLYGCNKFVYGQHPFASEKLIESPVWEIVDNYWKIYTQGIKLGYRKGFGKALIADSDEIKRFHDHEIAVKRYEEYDG